MMEIVKEFLEECGVRDIASEKRYACVLCFVLLLSAGVADSKAWFVKID